MLAPARLLDCQLFFFGPPMQPTGRAAWVRMHRVQEQHGFIRTKRVPQLLVFFDESPLFSASSLAADGFGLVVFQAQPVCQ